MFRLHVLKCQVSGPWEAADVAETDEPRSQHLAEQFVLDADVSKLSALPAVRL